MIGLVVEQYWRFGCAGCHFECIGWFKAGYAGKFEMRCPSCGRRCRVIERPDHQGPPPPADREGPEEKPNVVDMYARRRKQILLDAASKDVT